MTVKKSKSRKRRWARRRIAKQKGHGHAPWKPRPAQAANHQHRPPTTSRGGNHSVCA